MRKSVIIISVILLVLISSGCVEEPQTTTEVETTTAPSTTSAPIAATPSTTTPYQTTSAPTTQPPMTAPAKATPAPVPTKPVGEELPEPQVSASTPAIAFKYLHGILIGADVKVNVKNTGGLGIVELIYKVQNEEIGVGRKKISIKAGEEKSISKTIAHNDGVWGGIPGGEGIFRGVRVSPGEKVSFTVLASPLQYDFNSLILDLKQGDLEMRQVAANILGEIGDERAVEPLIQALKDEDWLVGRKAANALGKIGDERAVEPLIQALEDNEVQSDAILALGEIGDERAVEPIIPFLEHKYAYVRANAAEALGEIGDPRAVEPLTKVAEDIGEEDWPLRAAKEALEKING